MKRTTILFVAAAALLPALMTAPQSGAAARRAPAALTKKAIATGLDFPAGFAFLPDGRIIFGERNTGEIRLLDPATKKNTLLYQVSHVQSNGEQGLLGLAADPKYPSKPFIYAYATRALKSGLLNEILKIEVQNDKGVSSTVIFKSDTTPGDYHDGGHIAFGPDGMLYAVVGEGHIAGNAQNLNNNAGKVLRMTRNGDVPSDNPFTGKLIFAYGLRNSFGFTFDPQTGLLWETENGPECNDEINLEQSGENHAWGPSETCSGQAPQNTNQDGPSPRIMPLAYFPTTIAPTGVVFCDGCGLTNAQGNLFFGAYNTGQIREVKPTQDRRQVSSLFIAYRNDESILSMQDAPDGTIYFSTPTAIYELDQG
jgi:glucose/arabinose dehydrogenase